MLPARQKVGVREVAAAAGVSAQTVSRVLNEHPSIRDETRQRVLGAMATLNYRVNNAARALGTRESRTLGIVASDTALFGPAVGIAAVEAAARTAGRWVATTYADATEEASVDDAVDHLLGQGVDGIVLVALRAGTRQLLEKRAAGIPIVELHGGDGQRVQRDAAVLAVEHLVSLGHRRIARLGGPESWLEESARAAGFTDALSSHGLECVREWRGNWSAADGAACAAEVAAAVRRSGGPTAIVVANDQMALGLTTGLREAGVRVPEDLSIVGFDDNPDAAYYRPALTTIRVDVVAEGGRCVADVLGLSALASAQSPVLIERDSTARPARS
nr:substrate-binding domain-containing protein [Microbacterium endophyticum]